MHPPSYVCQAVYRLHKQLRVAWLGRERMYEDELNAGNFCVVQLYHIQDCGTYENPVTFREFWEVTPRLNEAGGLTCVPATRGPIFNRWGGGSRDWDPLFRKPIFAYMLEENDDILSGKMLLDLKHFMTDIVERVRESARQKGREICLKSEDLGREAGNFLWSEANKTGATSPLLDSASALKDLTPNYKNYREGKMKEELENIYTPPEPVRRGA